MNNEIPTVEDTYDYVLWEICKSPEGVINFVIRETAPTPPTTLTEIRAGLIPWGLSALTTTFHEMGLYWVTLHSADPTQFYATNAVSDHYITWGTGSLSL